MESVSPAFLYMFVALVLALLGGAVAIKVLFNRTPRLQDEFVAKSEYEKEQAVIKAELARHSASRKGIYEKLEQQGRSISSIEANMDQHGRDLESLNKAILETNDRLDDTNARIDAIPQRTISLLRETKGLI